MANDTPERLTRLEVKMEDVRDEVHLANVKLDKILILVQSQEKRINTLEIQRNGVAALFTVALTLFGIWATIHWG